MFLKDLNHDIFRTRTINWKTSCLPYSAGWIIALTDTRFWIYRSQSIFVLCTMGFLLQRKLGFYCLRFLNRTFVGHCFGQREKNTTRFLCYSFICPQLEAVWMLYRVQCSSDFNDWPLSSFLIICLSRIDLSWGILRLGLLGDLPSSNVSTKWKH